jgi:hypothetical protein
MRRPRRCTHARVRVDAVDGRRSGGIAVRSAVKAGKQCSCMPLRYDTLLERLQQLCTCEQALTGQFPACGGFRPVLCQLSTSPCTGGAGQWNESSLALASWIDRRPITGNANRPARPTSPPISDGACHPGVFQLFNVPAGVRRLRLAVLRKEGLGVAAKGAARGHVRSVQREALRDCRPRPRAQRCGA